MTESAPNSRAGTQFGPYRLRRLLGRGGMGEVYEAEDTVKGRVVALKLMNQELSADPVFRQRMQREAHTAGRLQEPHIVPIHDYGEIDGQLFIDMRLVEGTDVSTVLRRNGPSPPALAVAVIRQIASALDAAHSSGVIHRDIKPENILITGEDFAYLVDFGIAAAFTDQQNLTKTGTAIGSWNYLAPERFGNDEITYRADIYALACVLYECLTGATPFPTDSLPALMAAHLTRPAPRPSQHNPSIPPAFDHVIARGMAKNPADRYPTAGEFARAANDALSTTDQHRAATLLEHSRHSVQAPVGPMPWTTPPSWPPGGPPGRSNRNRRVLIGATLSVGVILAGTGIWLVADKSGDSRPTVAATSTLRTTGTTPATMPKLTDAQLDSVLLSAAQINGIMKTANIQRAETFTAMADPHSDINPEECRGAIYPGQASAYAGTGYTAVSGQRLYDATREHDVVQSVVAFGSADQAVGFVTSSAIKWKACAGRTVVQTYQSLTASYQLETLTGDPPKIVQLNRMENKAICQRVLSAVFNVVFDVAACSYQITDQGTEIVDALTARMPK